MVRFLGQAVASVKSSIVFAAIFCSLFVVTAAILMQVRSYWLVIPLVLIVLHGRYPNISKPWQTWQMKIVSVPCGR